MATGSFNPFSAANEERQNFPKFSPIFKSSTPVSETKPFRWSIDQLARLKPTHIDTNDSALALVAKHSPDNDAAKQNELDKYFMQTALPSPWPASAQSRPAKTAPPTRPLKHVSFIPPTTTFVNEEDLVESQIRDGRTADAGTQTTLTFPSDFDLEKLLMSLPCHDEAPSDLNGSCEWGGVEDETSLGNSLRRKLFGQPERQSSDSHSNDGGMDLSQLSSSPEVGPGRSSMVMSPGRQTPGLSPIGEGIEPPEQSSKNGQEVQMSIVVSSPTGSASGEVPDTPRRHVLPFNSAAGSLTKKPTSKLTSPVLSDDLVMRKEALKHRLKQESPVRTRSPISTTRASTVSPGYLRSPLEQSYREALMRSSPGAVFSPDIPSMELHPSSLGYYRKLTRSTSPPVLSKDRSFIRTSWPSLYSSQVCRSLLSPSHKRVKVRLKELHHY